MNNENKDIRALTSDKVENMRHIRQKAGDFEIC